MKNKIITILLTICMLIVYMPVVTFATNVSDIEEEQIEDQDMTEYQSEDVQEAEKLFKQMEGLSDENIDFSSQRLIVKGLDKELKDEPVIANLDGVSLIQYDSYEDAIEAYYRLSEISDSVEFDSYMSIASVGIASSGGDDSIPMTGEENPFTEADEIQTDKIKYDVAVIDTGATNADKVVSVLGDNGKDYNGHGQLMIDTIKTYAPNAKVLSIKAINDDGYGDVSAVYAAIKLAIEEKVDVINLSISAHSSGDNFIIEEIIAEAQSKGIKVIGAAGNNNMNANLTVPGKIIDAIIVGTTLESSNTGETVDYYVPVSSTSLATAVVTGLIISNTLDNYEVVNKVIKIKTGDDESGNITDPSDDFSTQGAGGSSSGGDSSSGGTHQNYKTGHTYVWYDRGGFKRDNQIPEQGYLKGTTKDSNGKYTNGSWHDGSSGKSTEEFFINKLTDKINSKDNGNWHYAWAVIDDHPSWQANITHKKYKADLKEACINALNRSKDPENERARVIGVAITYCHETKFSASGDTYKNIWYINSWHSKHNRKFDFMFGGGEDGVRYPNRTSELVIGKASNSSLENPWNSSVDKNRYLDAGTNQPWYEYAYKAAKKDVDQSYNDWKIYVVAVSDDWPDDPPVKVQLIKKWGADNTSTTVIKDIVEGNPAYGVEGTKFKLYNSKSDAQNNNDAVATFTIDENGKSEVRDVKKGNYYLVELGPPKNGRIIPNVLTAEHGGKKIEVKSNTTISIGDSPSTGNYTVSYEYTFAGGTLPSAVMNTLPSDSGTYASGDVVEALDPGESEIQVGDNHYVFYGWDSYSKTITDSNITFTGTWILDNAETEDEEGGAVLYNFVITDWPEDQEIPAEIIFYLPVDRDDDDNLILHDPGETVYPIDPAVTTIQVGDDTFVFMGWDKESDTFGDTGNITFTGTWQKVTT